MKVLLFLLIFIFGSSSLQIKFKYFYTQMLNYYNILCFTEKIVPALKSVSSPL